MLSLLLERKTLIIEELKRMNSLNKSDNEDFKQKYAWVCFKLLIMNKI